MTTLKMVAFAPIASASVPTTTSVKPGARTRPRAAYLKSLIHFSNAVFTSYVQHVIHRSIGPEALGRVDDPADARMITLRFVRVKRLCTCERIVAIALRRRTFSEP